MIQLRKKAASANGSTAQKTNGSKLQAVALEVVTNGRDRNIPIGRADVAALPLVLDGLHTLADRLDQVQASTVSPESIKEIRDTMQGVTDLLRTLPNLIAEAMSSALMNQHRLIIADIRKVLAEDDSDA